MVVLSSVPETILDEAALPCGVTMEVIEDDNFETRSALIDEKEKLLARLAEIEKMLDEKAVREELSTVDMVTAQKITDTLKNIIKGEK